MDAFTQHGGRLSQARTRFAAAPTPWIDLSTGLNPWPYPAAPADPAARARLPDPEETQALEAAAAQAFGLEPDGVLATPGAEAAIRLLAATLPVRHVAIAGPAYGGHAEAWREAGARVQGVDRTALGEAAIRAEALVVVNPNNPDGALTSPEVLADLAETLAARDGWMIVDEAFVEVAPAASVATLAGPDWPIERLVALRSFGKFYGLAGLRLGFVTGHPAVIARLRRRLGEWPVGADAIAAGLAAYVDNPWAEHTRRRLAIAASRLDALLLRAGFEVVGGTSLFRLTAAADARNRFIRLAEAGILTRPFEHDQSWLRLGLPADHHWPRLEAALLETAP